jgi:drug/metabolite transporter (DMT)-like permease
MTGSRTSAARSGDLALVGAALCFGGTFLVVQDAVERVEPVPFLALRFGLGALALWPLARRRPARPGEWRDGAFGGLALLAGYVLQTVGLQYTDSATSAFITYLLVVFVPLLGVALHRRRPQGATLAGVVLAVVGLVLLTDPGDGTGIGRGEVLTLGCAFAFAVHVLVVASTVGRHDPVRLAMVQVAVVGAGCALPGLFLGGYGFPLAAVAAAAATALVATALAFVLQVTGQRTVPPTRAALLLLLEPVFAGVLAGIVDEPLGTVQVLGAGVILVAIVLSELGPVWLDRSVRPREAGHDNDRSQGGPVA